MMTAQSGLTDAELDHFATEGWVLRERVLSPDECKALIDAADREQRRGKAKRGVPGALEDGTAADGAAFGRSEVDGEHGSLLHSPEEAEVFRRAVFHPRLSPVLAQLVGGEPAVDDSTGPLGCRVFRTDPATPAPQRARGACDADRPSLHGVAPWDSTSLGHTARTGAAAAWAPDRQLAQHLRVFDGCGLSGRRRHSGALRLAPTGRGARECRWCPTSPTGQPG